MKVILPFLALSLAAARAETFTYHHENVLGTSLDLRVSTGTETAARQAETAVLAEIDRLSAILNTWAKDSEISRWQAAGKPMEISADLAAVLKACDHWAANSQSAFSAGVKAPAAEMGKAAWTMDGTTATFTGTPGGITVDALAKGYIIDRAVEKAAGGVDSLTLNIGGDLRVTGRQTVSIADPHDDSENAAPLAEVTLENQSLATSGDYRRGNHIIDPRSGKPAGHIASASVIAPDAVTADALATIFNVLQPAESMAMADALPGVSCLIVAHDGGVFRSRGWKERSVNVPVAADNAPGYEMKVDFELDKPEAERYLRPYVAIWIEDKDDFPVRTLSLWLLKGEKGLRWLPDLKRWSRSDKTRRLADTTDIVPLISSATRNPGKYSVTWDGLDDSKKPLPAGEYTLYIEAAREKGTYQIMKHAFKVGEPFKKDLEGNIEVKGATIDYHQKAIAN